MNKKGFTLIELLMVIVIISLLGGIAIVGVKVFLSRGEKDYYNILEENMLLAGNDYFSDHRDELPIGSYVNEVSLGELVENKYIEQVVDVTGKACNSGRVYAYKENNKYRYEVCLECDDYKSDGKFCDDTNKIITVTAMTENTKKTYNLLDSFEKVGYTNGENVLVTFSMRNLNVVNYVIENTETKSIKSCIVTNNTLCTATINLTGKYKVTAYGKQNQILADDLYFNVKIA